MGGTIIREVGELLKQTLMENIDELPNENDYTFDSPAEIESGTMPKLSIFLYQILENSYLRNLYRESTGVPDQYREPPVVLDLYYLFTPYAANRETEWMILEDVSRLFRSHGMIVTENNPVLVESGNGKIQVAPGGLSIQDATEMWNSFPNKPFKLSMAYQLVAVKIPEEIIEIPKVDCLKVKVKKK